MIPKKHSELFKPVAEEFNINSELVNLLVEAYWKDVRKTMVNCEAHNIIVSGLGTFVAKSWKVPEVINNYQRIVDKYKSAVDSGQKITLQKFALMKEHQERIEVLKNLLGMIEADVDKKKEKQKYKKMIKILNKLWNDKTLILEGIKNSIFVKDKIEKIAQSRLEICEACPLIDREGSKCFAPGTQPCCGECGCKLAWKTRSLASECPHPDGARWVAVVSQEEEDSLYKDLDYNPDSNQTPTHNDSHIQTRESHLPESGS